MTASEEIQDHQARCQTYLLRLRLLARGEDESALPVAELSGAIDAVIAEAQAASHAVLTARRDGGHPGATTFLGVRLNRLAGAAEEAITAAREGDASRLRRLLHRFEAMTAAIWTAQHAVGGPAPAARRP